MQNTNELIKKLKRRSKRELIQLCLMTNQRDGWNQLAELNGKMEQEAQKREAAGLPAPKISDPILPPETICRGCGKPIHMDQAGRLR